LIQAQNTAFFSECRSVARYCYHSPPGKWPKIISRKQNRSCSSVSIASRSAVGGVISISISLSITGARLHSCQLVGGWWNHFKNNIPSPPLRHTHCAGKWKWEMELGTGNWEPGDPQGDGKRRCIIVVGFHFPTTPRSCGWQKKNCQHFEIFASLRWQRLAVQRLHVFCDK